MPSFYIYTSKYFKENGHSEKVPCSVTVIFCDRDSIEKANLQSEIKKFYESNYQTDEIFVIGGDYSDALLTKLFITDQLDTFKDIPKLQRDHLKDSLYLFTFDKDGNLDCSNKPGVISKKTTDLIINDGLVYIFKERGGLIEAKGNAHHFVFPSGKHCNKFLRTGNILLHSSEIYFIAFTLLSKYKEELHRQIYCDTSSINTLAFALLELKRKLVGAGFRIIPVESFSSYKGIFSKSIRFFENSLILISSSTSGNIIEKITKHHPNVDIANLVILYFLGSNSDYIKNKANIVCNLTKSASNPLGLHHYDTYTDRDCVYCKSGSYPVEVKGDVFLLEKPKINPITIKVTDAPKKLSAFVKQFKATNITDNNVLKVNYKETYVTSNKYEVYFDIHHVLCKIEDPENKLYKDYKERLYNFINQYVPSNAKYFITLPDEGSIKLAEIITNHIKPNYADGKLPEIVKFDDVTEKIKDVKAEGAVVIIGSCISNGKNLLYLSRTLRPFDKLRLVYFIGLARTNTEDYLNSLKSNLKQGTYGKESNSFVEVDSLFCNKDSKGTSWLKEKDFIADLIDAIEEQNLPVATKYFKDRIALIDESVSTKQKGLANSLFYSNTQGVALKLRKGFAFFNFTDYTTDVSQADVYFTINTVINSLRNSDDYEHCLRQTEFVRNVLDPHNFNRFNDGIIQACILRSAHASELSYHIDEELSNDMKAILEKVIEQHKTPQGEGLIEFLYAISVEKLTLKKEHLFELSTKLDSITDNELVKAFNFHIKQNILYDKPTLHEQIEILQKEIAELKATNGDKAETKVVDGSVKSMNQAENN
ncbi:MAG: hypothetical protein J0H29_02185 [Sphingobacteriales bacterium]|uniref:hypothetical protein n=1 Tax=uncultured Dysgonomonas sp. TaxID=206096 RepID=UPI000963D099|nr:hypothetical protein [uncultured Dysgonomonas sp.]MBN8857165.1 hypothetical protein [Sphingobacteriales bacterium]OJY87997.1 MAG: hypothetical protein BGP14_21385 [Sphingobacteriales bacterium 44-15]